jgi:excisionase family DNA binding protein
MLFPFKPEQFWQFLRQVIREEVENISMRQTTAASFETAGMTYKPLYKIEELCTLFLVTRPTIYDWVKHGKLKPYKIRQGFTFYIKTFRNF